VRWKQDVPATFDGRHMAQNSPPRSSIWNTVYSDWKGTRISSVPLYHPAVGIKNNTVEV
jgi:hypothetical protein